jgi:hypothetical protein
MKRLLAIIIATLGITLVGGPALLNPAAAGGWALTTLDEYPTPVAGEEVAVGFTILQHGKTPVRLEASDKVGLQLTGPSGASEFFPATPEGAVGHYVATVRFAEAGEHTWAVHQGWFGLQDLGSLEVGADSVGAATSSAGSTTSADSGSPAWLRYGLLVIAVAMGGFALFDAIRSRRKPAVA